MKLKPKMSIKILSTRKKCLTLVIIQLIQNKMKTETADVVIGEFVGLKRKMYCIW